MAVIRHTLNVRLPFVVRVQHVGLLTQLIDRHGAVTLLEKVAVLLLLVVLRVAIVHPHPVRIDAYKRKPF